MITTGVVALDDRLGGLRPGALYCFFGPASAGKSVLGLHFLLDGLAHGERCVLVTRDEPALVDSRARYVGYPLGRFSEHEQLHIIRMPVRLPGSTLQPAEALARWLGEQLGSKKPTRIVFDAIDALSDYADPPTALLHEVATALLGTGAVTYAMGRTDKEAHIDPERFGPLLRRAAGVFSLLVKGRGEREFTFQSPPDGAYRPEPFNYTLRIGGGFTEELPLDVAELDPADRRRVIVLDEIGALSPEAVAGLGSLYELELLRSSAGALGRLSAGRYGALVLVVDPFDEARAFDLVFALRKEGNAAPIVFAAPSRGLRTTTRSRGLRVGGDDFFSTDLPAVEVVERVQMAWFRGRHSRLGLSQIGQIVQPVNGNGSARPMTEPEFRQAVQTLLAEQPPLFFCYLEFTLHDTVSDVVWPALRTRIRLGDGDIIGLLSGRRFACVLDRITPEQTWRVVERIRGAHPGLHGLDGVVVIASPMHADAIAVRLAQVTTSSGAEVNAS